MVHRLLSREQGQWFDFLFIYLFILNNLLKKMCSSTFFTIHPFLSDCPGVSASIIQTCLKLFINSLVSNLPVHFSESHLTVLMTKMTYFAKVKLSNTLLPPAGSAPKRNVGSTQRFLSQVISFQSTNTNVLIFIFV